MLLFSLLWGYLFLLLLLVDACCDHMMTLWQSRNLRRTARSERVLVSLPVAYITSFGWVRCLSGPRPGRGVERTEDISFKSTVRVTSQHHKHSAPNLHETVTWLTRASSKITIQSDNIKDPAQQ